MSDTRAKKILHVVGARPNFMKVAPVMKALSEHPDRLRQVLVHTGQHYDYQMSALFFEELEIPEPDYNLGIGSDSHGAQTGRMLIETETILLKERPGWVFVYGDTNSALAGALAAAKLHMPVAHVEAGLRSFDRTMPEEVNRIVTDQVASLLFTPSRDGDQNLLHEGISKEKIEFVGNVMIDTLAQALTREERLSYTAAPGTEGLLEQLNGRQYVLTTLHRPSNVDDPRALSDIVSALGAVSAKVPVIFPVHPRTQKRMQEMSLREWPSEIRLLEPLGYFDFLALMRKASVVVTDSGGIQEETTYLGIPCLTVRPNTERPVTITHGTNALVSSQPEVLLSAIEAALRRGHAHSPAVPPELWDGRASQRIVDVLLRRN
ncbi:MAG: UDP-N-acetylglucosamine 2-epimerase (non-hydrolyzing) [Chloroflexota bacterium]